MGKGHNPGVALAQSPAVTNPERGFKAESSTNPRFTDPSGREGGGAGAPRSVWRVPRGKGALSIGLAFVGFLEQLPQVLRHEVRLLRRAVVALQVLHCNEKAPAPRRGQARGWCEGGSWDPLTAIPRLSQVSGVIVESFSGSDTAKPAGIEKGNSGVWEFGCLEFRVFGISGVLFLGDKAERSQGQEGTLSSSQSFLSLLTQPRKKTTPQKQTKPQSPGNAQGVFGEGFGSCWDGNGSVHSTAVSW